MSAKYETIYGKKAVDVAEAVANKFERTLNSFAAVVIAVYYGCSTRGAINKFWRAYGVAVLDVSYGIKQAKRKIAFFTSDYNVYVAHVEEINGRLYITQAGVRYMEIMGFTTNDEVSIAVSASTVNGKVAISCPYGSVNVFTSSHVAATVVRPTSVRVPVGWEKSFSDFFTSWKAPVYIPPCPGLIGLPVLDDEKAQAISKYGIRLGEEYVLAASITPSTLKDASTLAGAMEFLEELSGHVRLGLKSNIKVYIKGATALSPVAALLTTFPTTAVPVVAPVAASAAPPVVAPAVTTKAAIQTITKTVASAYHVYGKKYNVVNVGLRMVRPYDQYLYNPSNDTLINVKQNPGIIPVEASAGGNGAMFVGNYSFLPDIGAALQHARSVQAKIDKYNSRLLKWYEENPNATESEKKRFVENLRHSYQQWR